MREKKITIDLYQSNFMGVSHEKKTIYRGDVAQMVERLICIHEVRGSMPLFSIFFEFRAGTLKSL